MFSVYMYTIAIVVKEISETSHNHIALELYLNID